MTETRLSAKITAKGQITIPRQLRRALGLRVGDRVEFAIGPGGARMEPSRSGSPFEAYQGIGNPGIASGRRGVTAWVRRLRQP